MLVPAAPADSDALLGFLAATQKQTLENYSKLSYEGAIENTRNVKKLGKAIDFSSHYSVVHQSNTTLLTRELYTTIIVDENPDGGGPPTYEVSHVPSVKRVLKTPEYIAVWSNVGDLSFMMYFREDWEAELGRFENSFEFTYRPVSILKRCFGQSTPFYRLYERETSLARWHAAASAEGGPLAVRRELPDSDMKYHFDLDLSIMPENGLISYARFKRPHDVVVGTVNVSYTTMAWGDGELKVPARYRYTNRGGPPESDSTIEIQYSGFRDDSDLPPMTLADLGAPPKLMLLNRTFPDSRLEQQIWDGSEPDVATWKVGP